MRILSPAKINLGLSVLGKRPDGYHEIDTILAMLDLNDVITLTETNHPGITIAGMDDVPVANNLITRAIQGWCEIGNRVPAFHIDIIKRIPSPAGLGGGSSNAAAVIRAMNALYPDQLTAAQMHELAASLGADCPFFLGTAAARATGIGTDLEPLISPRCSTVIVVPPTEIAAKTATLYGQLDEDDFGAPDEMDAVQIALETGDGLEFPNSFTRAALAAFPQTRVAWDALHTFTGSCNLSGAGPAVFALSHVPGTTEVWADQLRELLPTDFFITTSTFIDKPPAAELLP